MAGNARAVALARTAAGLAAGAGIALPDSLAIWRLAGGQPACEVPIPADDPAQRLGEALEATLTERDRRRGAHYTPPPVADRVVALGLDGAPARPLVVDPACGGGAVLLAAARHLARGGVRRDVIARDLLWGADLDPLAAAVAEAAVALWSGGPAPAAGHVVAGETLLGGAAAWPAPPAGGFDAVVGNPPFQGQLGRSTARSAVESERLRRRFGAAVTQYVDTAALFLLAAVELVGDRGGRVALVQPQSTVASRDAGGVRAALAERARLVDLWAPHRRLFDAAVQVCVPVLQVGEGGPSGWADRLATARGVPLVDLGGAGTVTDLAVVVAGFRDEYYGLVDHVREAGPEPEAPLVTSGILGVGCSMWGASPVRFAKRGWLRPEVDLAGLARANPKVAAWVDRVRRPKVVVASQTRVIEAAVDRHGTWVPSTPVVSVLPHDPADVHRVAAVLCSPPVSAWAARRAAGTALSADAIRVSAGLVGDAPLPQDHAEWSAASAALAAGDVHEFADRATAMYGLPAPAAGALCRWWRARLPRAKPTWPAEEVVR